MKGIKFEAFKSVNILILLTEETRLTSWRVGSLYLSILQGFYNTSQTVVGLGISEPIGY